MGHRSTTARRWNLNLSGRSQFAPEVLECSTSILSTRRPKDHNRSEFFPSFPVGQSVGQGKPPFSAPPCYVSIEAARVALGDDFPHERPPTALHRRAFVPWSLRQPWSETDAAPVINIYVADATPVSRNPTGTPRATPPDRPRNDADSPRGR